MSGDVYAYDGNVAFGPSKVEASLFLLDISIRLPIGGLSSPYELEQSKLDYIMGYEDRLSNMQKSYIEISWRNKWFHFPEGKLKYKDGELCECN